MQVQLEEDKKLGFAFRYTRQSLSRYIILTKEENTSVGKGNNGEELWAYHIVSILGLLALASLEAVILPATISIDVGALAVRRIKSRKP